VNGAGHSLAGVTEVDLAALIAARARGPDRFIMALAGPPGSGKTTLTSALVGHLGPEAAVLPMDTFHLDNDRLHALGRQCQRKLA
jgi:uridine kinase